ncbi:MAG: PAS domain S-box protein [Syntrophales bacterium]|jgi:PAS domain S-box-containing protein|nr:PAS domain S-box protein [Syntrophales bacterium]MCK9528364.1 PAS domain S-box protein [Syntrophales bacterium]MDX9922711.1 PAS domain S-box protein [Syntrophales bacterium]
MIEKKNSEGPGPSPARTSRDKELIYLTPLAVIEIGRDGRILDANRHGRKLLGFSRNENRAGGENIFDRIDAADHDLVRARIKSIRAGEPVFPTKIRVLRRDGTVVPVLIVYANLIAAGGKETGIRAAMTGCAEEIETDHVHWRIQEKYRKLVDLLPQGVFETDAAGRVIYANRSMLKMFRLTAEDIRGGLSVADAILPKERPRMNKIMQRLENGKKPCSETVGCLRKDGSVFPGLFTGRGIVRNGTFRGIWGIVADGTVRRETAGNVGVLDEPYRSLFFSAGTAMIIIEDDMSISLANEAFYRFSGYPPGENLTLSSLVPDEDRDFMTKTLRERAGGEKTVPLRYEFRHVRRDGGVRDGILSAELIPGTRRTLASVVDITDLKQTQKKLQRESENLLDAKAALNVLLKRREEDRSNLGRTVRTNLKHIVLPHLDMLKAHRLSAEGTDIIAAIEDSLEAILSPFLQDITATYAQLTPREIEILILVKEGRSTKEISRMLNSSQRTIDYHRNNIRRKLGISNSRVNLRTHIMTHLDAY